MGKKSTNKPVSGDELLRKLIQKTQTSATVCDLITPLLIGVLSSLGMTRQVANQWMLARAVGRKIGVGDLYGMEARLSNSLGPYIKNFDDSMLERGEGAFKVIEPWLTLCYAVLDFGGGSGEIANSMLDHGCDVSIADIRNWSHYAFPFLPVRMNKVALEDRHFNDVTMLNVLRHCNAPEKVLAEAFRLADRRVIIIESVPSDPTSFLVSIWLDWIYNRVLHYSNNAKQKIPMPCNFRTVQEWEKLIEKLTGKKPKVSKAVKTKDPLNPQPQHIFVIEREDSAETKE